jgi:hypothetical protein
MPERDHLLIAGLRVLMRRENAVQMDGSEVVRVLLRKPRSLPDTGTWEASALIE